jgi:hypothetical protein
MGEGFEWMSDGGEGEMMIDDCCSYACSSSPMTSVTVSVSWAFF